MIAIRYGDRGCTYMAEFQNGSVVVQTSRTGILKTQACPTEREAYIWLGNHGLKRGRIQRLLDAAVRNQGEFANPNHPKRIKVAG